MKKKLVVFITSIVIPLLLYALEEPDSHRITTSQAYNGGDQGLLYDLAKNLKFNKEIIFPGITCDIKIYFNYSGEIYDIEVESRSPCVYIETIDSITNSLLKLPNWKVPPSSEKLRILYIRNLCIDPPKY